MEFGHETNTKLLTYNGTSTMLWLLSKVMDNNGNYCLYKYAMNNTDRDYALAEIDYTGNTAKNLLPYNKIEFGYTVRNNWPTYTMYDGGEALSNPFNLDRIIIKNDVGDVVLTYKCNYTLTKNQYYLNSVQEIASNGASLNSTIFTYGGNTTGADVSISPIYSNNLLKSGETYAGDFNGDGVQDVLAAKYYFDNNNLKHYTGYELYEIRIPGLAILDTYTAPDNSSTNLTMEGAKSGYANYLMYDYDGDGKDDILMTKKYGTWGTTFTGIRINYSRKYNSNYGVDIQTVDYNSIPTSTEYGTKLFNIVLKSGNFFIPGDFDGDGYQDYILILGMDLTETKFKAFLSCPAKGIFNEEISNFGTSFSSSDPFPANSVANATSLIPVDYNGDGATDILATYNGVSYILSVFPTSAATGYKYSAQWILNISEIQSNYEIFTGDYNGDKKTDFLVRNYPSKAWDVLYSNGGYSFKKSTVYF